MYSSKTSIQQTLCAYRCYSFGSEGIQEGDNDCEKYVLVQYKVPDDFSGFFCKHLMETLKEGESFIRSKPTVLEKVHDELKSATPRHVISLVDNNADAPAGLVSPSDITRDRQQV